MEISNDKLLEMTGFISLVKRMREAQNEKRKYGTVFFETEEERVAYNGAISRMLLLESDVDEYLKKMIDKVGE